MAGRGRGRFGRPEDRNILGRKKAPPSRFLWVGNLANSVTNNILANHFVQFGELERVSLQVGRSFAFVDFKYEEAAFAAMKALQGFVLAGSPIIVEFTKENKFSSQSTIEEVRKPDPRTLEDLPPSEALWVGYPPFIEVDESILRKAFSPFGAIHKVTTFTDRSYAFVCFENISSASRAKMVLEGKLFGNPRVQIRFAKSETGSKNLPISPPIQHRNLRNVPQFNEEFGDGSVSFKKARTGSFAPEDELPEFSLPGAQMKLKEWEWEGIIAKGGKRVCRARCFPVGKPMDMMLPAFIDCTARTSTEMLSKHYYQARSSWVVFFVPQTDADIGSYNDFMQYLEEKQRVAVARINDNTSLFLVAPSEFSQNVLKVPGKLSISGVVLRLELQNPSTEPSNDTRDASFGSHVPVPYPRVVQESNFHNYSHELPQGSADAPLSTLQPVLGKRSVGHPDNAYGVQQGYDGVGYSTGNQLTAERPQDLLNMPVPTLQSEQLAQLASTLARGPSSSQSGLQQAEDSDPGRRLQATLQLAATLLQNVQQRRGT